MDDFSFGANIKRGIAKIFDPRGRDNRKQFWLFALFPFAIVMPLAIIGQFWLTLSAIPFDAVGKVPPEQLEMAMYEPMFKVAAKASYFQFGLFTIGLLAILTASARRLQDRGRSGWFAVALPLSTIALGYDQAQRMDVMIERLPAKLKEMAKAANPDDPLTGIRQSMDIQALMPPPQWLAIVAALLMLWLVVELVRAGDEGENRYGVPQ